MNIAGIWPVNARIVPIAGRLRLNVELFDVLHGFDRGWAVVLAYFGPESG